MLHACLFLLAAQVLSADAVRGRFGGLRAYARNTYQLKEGDSVSFNADEPHILINTGKGLLKAYWIITPPPTTNA